MSQVLATQESLHFSKRIDSCCFHEGGQNAKSLITSRSTPTANAKRKSTFGSSNIDHFSPALPVGTPKAINVTLSFEEALKLHLSPGQLLGHLNGYNLSTSYGKRMAVNLCVYTNPKRIAVVEGKIRKPGAAKAAEQSESVSDE